MHDLVGQYCDDDLSKPKTTTSVNIVGTKNKNKNIYNNNNLAVVSSSEGIIDDNKIRNDDLR